MVQGRRKEEKDPFPASREKDHHSPALKVSMTPASARFSRVSSSRAADARTAGRAANPSRYREAVFYPSVLARTDARRARVAFSPPGLVLSINSPEPRVFLFCACEGDARAFRWTCSPRKYAANTTERFSARKIFF